METVTEQKSEVLELAVRVIDLCRQHTSSRVVATTATSVAATAISAEWPPEAASDGVSAVGVLKSPPSE